MFYNFTKNLEKWCQGYPVKKQKGTCCFYVHCEVWTQVWLFFCCYYMEQPIGCRVNFSFSFKPLIGRIVHHCFKEGMKMFIQANLQKRRLRKSLLQTLVTGHTERKKLVIAKIWSYAVNSLCTWWSMRWLLGYCKYLNDLVLSCRPAFSLMCLYVCLVCWFWVFNKVIL